MTHFHRKLNQESYFWPLPQAKHSEHIYKLDHFKFFESQIVIYKYLKKS